jgi:hypothetical protein
MPATRKTGTNASTGPGASAATAGPDWFRTVKRTYLLDFQMPDSADQMPLGQPRNLRDIDPERIVHQLHEHGVQAVYVHAKDNQGNCYYDTQLGHKHTGIGDRDLMREFSAACRSVGMKSLYYVQLSRERRANEDRLYAARNFDGSPVIGADPTPQMPSLEERPVACLNGPFREYQLAIIRELSTNYDFDGFWLDAFGWWGRTNPCYCDFCKAKYRTDVGASLPAPDDKESAGWKRYLTWRRRLNHLIMHELEDAARSANPHLSLTHNGSGTQTWADWEHCDRDDYVTHEYHYQEGLGNLSLLCNKQRALHPDTPFEIEIWRFFTRGGGNMFRGYQVRPPAMHQTEMATVLAHGGFPQYYDQINPDGSLDRRSLAVMKEAFDFVQEREPWLDADDRRVPYCGLVWSKATDGYAQPAHGRAHMAALEGAYYALMEAHLPMEVLADRQVAAGDFRSHKAVVLPNAECLSSAEVAALEAYVRGGGGLVATHRTSLCDERGAPRAAFGLGELFGLEYLEPATYLYSFVQAEVEHPVNDGLELNWPRTLWRLPQAKVRLRQDAAGAGSKEAPEALAWIVNPMRGFHMGHPPAERTPHPSIVVRCYGKGRVVYFAAPIDQAYAEYGHPDHARWLVNAVRWAAGEAPAVEVEAPSTVEAVAWTHGDGKAGSELRVHLVNRTAAGPQRLKSAVFDQHIPVLDVRVSLADRGRRYTSAVLQPGSQKLSVKREGGAVVAIVPRLDAHGVVVVT